MENTGEIMGILRELGNDGEGEVVYFIRKIDQLEAVVWQLYDTGCGQNLKYGIGGG